jgi:hypothetical protein
MTDYKNLRLVTVNADYNGWPGGISAEDKRQEFFAYDHDDESFVRLLLPTDKGRLAGFYSQTSDGPENVGWNLHRRFVTDVTKAAAPEVAPEATPEPWTPALGDKVRVVAVPDGSWGAPADVVKIGAIGTYRFIDTLDQNRHHLLRFDNGSEYWVKEVGPAIPTTEEEFTAALLAATEAGRVEGRREGRRSANEEFESWKRMANETAIQYANDNSLCSEFDRCMLAIGLEPRDSYERNWEVTVTYNITVSATSEDDVEEAAMDVIGQGYVSPEVDYEEA